ncbi:MAG: M23 family metallopeptidase [Clostridia bacterium]|nr:M23 family metallopeptidase [Clostridia bacterium]
MKTGIKLVTFFKKHGYWLVLVAAFALLVTIIALSVNAGNVALEDEQTQPAEQTSVKEVTFAMPITSATVAKEYSNSALQYNKTLNLWQSHKAIDFLAEEGTDVFAVLDGTIKEVTYSYLMGNILKLDVGNGMIVVYASLQNDIPVKAGDVVKRGDVIGKVGNTAKSESSDGAHLHLEVWLDDQNVDPSIYLDLENK